MTLSPIAKQVILSNTFKREIESIQKQANERAYKSVFEEDPMEVHKRIVSVFEEKGKRK